ncbi:hypothetical protein DL93DRAFT_1124730 [Clavulina sp. PMI_390]|nr:hypothetical protein DL93DRAFT_1124730 [Clavulina sp. PMI_390]
MHFWQYRNGCYIQDTADGSGRRFGLHLHFPDYKREPRKLFLCPDGDDADLRLAMLVQRQFCPLSGTWMLPRARSTIHASDGWDVTLFYLN